MVIFHIDVAATLNGSSQRKCMGTLPGQKGQIPVIINEVTVLER